MARLEPMGVEAVIKGLPGFLSGMSQMGDATQRTGGLIGKIGGIAKGAVGGLLTIGTAAAGAATAGVMALGGALLKLASDAAPIEGVRSAFVGMTQDIEGGSEAMLKALQDASLGMTTNTDLMKSFNLAAQLVSKDFAQQLPDAMQYLAKVAAATGQDMGFMMDSLVRGVGRLSPMILDNLAIQVDLTTAYEDWAKANNRTVESMTKTEQQSALMAQVMAKLAENTASMPEVAGTAQQAFASFGIQMKNFKDELGLAVLPAIKSVMASVGEMAKKILPAVVDFVKKNLVPILERVAQVIEVVVKTGLGSKEMWEALSDLLGEGLTNALKFAWEWFGKFGEILEVVGKFLLGVAADGDWMNDWLTHLPEWLQPVVKAFGQFINFLKEEIPKGIQAVKDFWDAELKPVFENIRMFIMDKVVPAVQSMIAAFADNIPIIIGAVKDFWENSVKPAFEGVWNVIQERVIPSVMNLVAAFQEHIPAIQATAQEFIDWFRTNIVPVFSDVVANIGDVLQELGVMISDELDGIAEFWRKHGDTVIDSVKFVFELIVTTVSNTLNLFVSVIEAFLKLIQGDWEGAWTAIKDFLVTLLNSALSIVGMDLEEFVGVWTGIWENIKTIVFTVWDSIVSGIKGKVDAVIKSITDGFSKIKNKAKDILGIKSPSKIFEGYGQDLMAGLAQGIQSAFSLPELSLTRAVTNLIQPISQVPAPMMASAGGVTNAQTYQGDNMNLNIYTSAPSEDIIADFRMLKAMGSRI